MHAFAKADLRKPPISDGPRHHDGQHESPGRSGVNAAWRSFSLRTPAPQPKLTVDSPDHPREREADRVADAAVRPATGPQPQTAQRNFATTSVPIRRHCDSCSERGDLHSQRHARADHAHSSAPASSLVEQTLNRPGQPLDAQTRGFFEARLGHDFSRVRVHTDTLAEASAQELDAHAYTVGDDIAFASGRYAPATPSGRWLIAHELAHVAQGAPNRLQPYRDVKSSERKIKNFGGVDDAKAGLKEKARPEAGDPVIETIHIEFTGNAADTANPGELLVTGTLTAKYRAADKRPDIKIPVTGGTTAARPFGLTDRVVSGKTVTKVQGPGYNDRAVSGPDAQPAPKGEQSHYVKQSATLNHAAFDFASSMGLAVYFNGSQAIHLGDKTVGSHACIHVDWTAHKNEMRLINYHSLVGKTKVTVAYLKNAAFKAVCCSPTRQKRGFVNPCNVYSAADCGAAPARATPGKKP